MGIDEVKVGDVNYIFEVGSVFDRDLSCGAGERCGDCWRLHGKRMNVCICA